MCDEAAYYRKIARSDRMIDRGRRQGLVPSLPVPPDCAYGYDGVEMMTPDEADSFTNFYDTYDDKSSNRLESYEDLYDMVIFEIFDLSQRASKELAILTDHPDISDEIEPETVFLDTVSGKYASLTNKRLNTETVVHKEDTIVKSLERITLGQNGNEADSSSISDCEVFSSKSEASAYFDERSPPREDSIGSRDNINPKVQRPEIGGEGTSIYEACKHGCSLFDRLMEPSNVTPVRRRDIGYKYAHGKHKAIFGCYKQRNNGYEEEDHECDYSGQVCQVSHAVDTYMYNSMAASSVQRDCLCSSTLYAIPALYHRSRFKIRLKMLGTVIPEQKHRTIENFVRGTEVPERTTYPEGMRMQRPMVSD